MSPAATQKGLPKLLYINPTGGNPTGTVITGERRREVYGICREYDLLIVEDDPYYFIRYGDDGGAPPPSFLSLDVDGRVVRIDSFSKTVGAGLRVGYATGPAELIDRMELHLQVGHGATRPLSSCRLMLPSWEPLSEWVMSGS